MNTRTKSLFGYIFPALGGLFVTYLYNVVDGIFVGQGVGSAALGAVNIGVPFITFVIAIAAMFPMGGATVVAIRMGRGDKEGANHAFMTALSMTLAVSILLTIVGTVFAQQIVDLSGASKLSAEMREMSRQYLLFYSAFSIPALLSTSLSVFVRNDGSPALAFVGMCTGAVANVFLDWLFIFPLQMGVVGAAVASGLGQICSVLVLLTHFIRKKGALRIRAFKIDLSLVRKITKRGVPDHKAYMIYYYEDRIDNDGNRIVNIRVYDDTQVWHFTRVNDGEIKPDKAVKPNPQPHSIYQMGNSGKIGGMSYGMIPFFRMDNCKKQVSALPPIKDLIDDYDLMNAGLSNNIQDTNEALYVVRGFQGDNLDELITNIRAKKHIGVDEEGGVDVMTVAIPVEARKIKMEVDEKNIYRFGFALNTAGLKDTAATTNLAIQSAYSLLELRAKKLENRLKPFLRKLIDVVLKEINEENGTGYSQSDIYFCFEREIPTNAQENAQIELVEAQRRQTEITTILNLAGTIDDETKLQLICEQLDLDYQMLKDKFPKEEDSTAVAQELLNDVPVEE